MVISESMSEDIFDLMHSGKIYDPGDERLMKVQAERLRLLKAYNELDPADAEGRERMLSSMFRHFGAGSYIEIPFHANWAGMFAYIGEGVYANFNLTLIDDGLITIGDHTMIGPNVTITTATHPESPSMRARGLQLNRSVTVGKNCFIAAGVIILPGVTIGDNSIIGAGSVVTRSVPPNVVAFGSPCTVVRTIASE